MSSDAPLHRTHDPALRTVDVPPDALEAFAHPRRWAVISILQSSTGTMSASELTERVIEHEQGCEMSMGDDLERTTVGVSLYHSHLPKLADHEIVAWNPETGRVSLTDDPQTRAWIRSTLESETASRCRTLASARRRSVLAVLSEWPGAVSVSALADAVAARADETPELDGDRLAVSLRHSHLPALETAGFLEYDAEADVVTELEARE